MCFIEAETQREKKLISDENHWSDFLMKEGKKTMFKKYTYISYSNNKVILNNNGFPNIKIDYQLNSEQSSKRQ